MMADKERKTPLIDSVWSVLSSEYNKQTKSGFLVMHLDIKKHGPLIRLLISVL
jgi:hypothetical protein